MLGVGKRWAGHRTEATVGGGAGSGEADFLVWPGWPEILVPSLKRDRMSCPQPGRLPQPQESACRAEPAASAGSGAFILFATHLL